MTRTARGDIEYRYDLPKFSEVRDEPAKPEWEPVDRLNATDLGDFMEEMLSLGRRRNAKKELYAEHIPQWTVRDMYLLFRIVTGKPFCHPERALGLSGTNHVFPAVAEALWPDDPTRDADWLEAQSQEASGLSDFLLELDREDALPEGETDPSVQHLYSQLLDLEEMGSQKEIRNLIREEVGRMQSPWVFTHMLRYDFGFYVGQYMIRDAIAMAFDDDADRIDRAWQVTNDMPVVFVDYVNGEMKTELYPHAMHGVMKAESDYEVSDIPDLQSSGQWVAQTKYDGVRLFVHHSGDGDYRAYMGGRDGGGKDITAVLPELFEPPLSEQLPEHAFILDCEATPYDAETGEVKPFQNILRRTGRTPGAEGFEESDTEGLEVRFKFFDCLYWWERDLREVAFEDRYEVVRSVFAPPFVARQGSDLEATFLSSVDRGHEGVVLKRLGHHFQPNTRSSDWQKWKAQPETLDVQVVDANRGSGRISDRLGALKIAVELGDELVSVGSVGTGFTDTERMELWKDWEAGVLEGSVVEVSFEELQFGTGRDDVDTSWALRFPSFQRTRPDGSVDSLRKAAKADGKLDEYESWLDEHGLSDGLEAEAT